MKQLAAILTLAFAAQAQAEFYVGGNAGVYRYDQEVDVTGAQDIEIRDYALGVHSGYMLYDWIGVEVSYLNFLEGGEKIGNTADLRAKGDSVSLALRPAWRISQDFELFAKLGVAFWNAKLRYTVPELDLTDKESDNGSDFNWGVGGRWWGGDHWSLALEFNRIEADTEVQFDTVTFNLAYHF